MTRTLVLIALVGSLAVPASAQEGMNHAPLVAAVKADLIAHGVDLLSACGAFQITKRVAWVLRGEGIGLIKKGGNNCDGYSTDAVMYRATGTVIDLLVGSGDTNGPTWNVVGTRPLSDWAAPIDPGDVVTPPPPSDLAVLTARVDALQAQLATYAANARAFAMLVSNDVGTLTEAVAALKARPIVTGCSARIAGIPISCRLTP
jgi:hypothetical protein